ncbi:hypothetical protein CTM93_00010 [Photobacterium phosphoreum]|uniref:hypothetical protein n=1 Tax=Photobacterium phosphoreum TaxID=659 RepID=UPI000D182859|nr:hypothetical protein [Photobacterium phosphoreum]PSU86190.1 hypothetical protein CTM93_00010 [Photobacterium phosphoreum]
MIKFKDAAPLYKSDMSKIRDKFKKIRTKIIIQKERDHIALSPDGNDVLKSLITKYEQTDLSNMDALQQISEEFNEWIDSKYA